MDRDTPQGPHHWPTIDLFRDPVYTTKIIFSVFGIFLILYGIFISPPKDFTKGTAFIIKGGATLSQVSSDLSSAGIVRSPRLFKLFLLSTFNQDDLISGEYLLHSKQNMFTIARRVIRGNFGFDVKRIIILEGSASHDIPKLFDSSFVHFVEEDFINLASLKEGYLFPDTYFFYTTVKAENVIDILTKTFEDKIYPFTEDIKNSKRSLKDIVIMASIVEREALHDEDRALVSGVLWKRIDIGMALQVDAPFAYVSNKSTYELTTEDLRADSPYNTYTRRGLPPTPISNPGLSSIKASIFPEKSNYLYYLSDKKGTIYYAETFEGHKQNRLKYLGK